MQGQINPFFSPSFTVAYEEDMLKDDIITIALLEEINSTYAFFTNTVNSCYLHTATSTPSHLLLPYYTCHGS